MSDLRALLCDSYDDVIERATQACRLHSRVGVPVENLEPSCDECGYAWSWPGIGQIEGAVRREAHRMERALAAVLPDLLADAWDEGADFAVRHPGMSAEYTRTANPYRPNTEGA